MKNSLNILTQQKQQEIDERIKEKQNKEILQSLKRDIIIYVVHMYIKKWDDEIRDGENFRIRKLTENI